MQRSMLTFLCLAVLPARLWAGEIKIINGDAEFPEGPFWADGKLY
jgi:hypothetical protein